MTRDAIYFHLVQFYISYLLVNLPWFAVLLLTKWGRRSKIARPLHILSQFTEYALAMKCFLIWWSYNFEEKLSQFGGVAGDLLSRLLTLDPEMRNASDTETDFRKHVFFSQMDWNQIEARSIDAPIITTTRDRKTRDQIEILNDYFC